MTEYAKGGYINGGQGRPQLTPIVLDPDECLISSTNVRARRLACSRADHPTPTSDCTKHANGIRHESEDRVTVTLAEAGHPVPTMPMGQTCAVHKHREWVPIEAHHIWPKGMGGPDVAANKVNVCANGHYSIHEVIRRLIAHGGVLPDSQHFSAKVRALGMRGWTEAGKPTKGGGGE